jgi:hypothetical protein
LTELKLPVRGQNPSIQIQSIHSSTAPPYSLFFPFISNANLADLTTELFYPVLDLLGAFQYEPPLPLDPCFVRVWDKAGG